MGVSGQHHTPNILYPLERNPVPFEKGGWMVWMGVENLASTRV